MINIYDIDAEACPECEARELVYLPACAGVRCQNCGNWFNLEGKLLEEEN